MEATNLKLSLHATKRMAQRGLSHEIIGAILDYHDRYVYCGGSCRCINITRKKLHYLVEDGILKPTLAEKLQNILVVLNEDDLVISVYPRKRRCNRAAVKHTKSYYHRRSCFNRRRSRKKLHD